MRQTILITGCSSGIGRLTAETFQREGWNVVATMRSPEKESELTSLENVLVTRLDVTDPVSIDAAVAAALDRFGSIEAVVNNAGYGGHRLFEQSDDGFVRAMYDTNVFGVMNVCRAVLPRMRRQGSGCVVNVTSMAGMLGAPTISVYASSKFAVEGLSEAMALEYRPFGVSIKTVAPGAYPTTRFGANTDDELGTGDHDLVAYADDLHRRIQGVAEQMATQGGEVADPQEVADRIYECVTSSSPVHNPVGADAQLLIGMMSSGSRQDFLEKLAEMLLPAGR